MGARVQPFRRRAKSFLVTVRYVEPTYALHSGSCARQHEWTYAIYANVEDEAKRRALHEFREMAALSSVSWTREIVSVECRPVEIEA